MTQLLMKEPQVWCGPISAYFTLKHHPSLGPGSVDDSSVAPTSCEGDASSAARSHTVIEDLEDEMQTRHLLDQ